MKYEAVQVANQLTDLFKYAPDIDAVNPKDAQGNVELDIGKHVVPNAVIGAGIALYADTFKRKLPAVSAGLATASCFVIGLAYEGFEACGDDTPGVHGAVAVCKAGYLDGATPKKATFDTIADVAFGSGVGFAVASLLAVSAFAIRRKFHQKPFYKMKMEKEKKHILMWGGIKPADRKIIEIIPDDN